MATSLSGVPGARPHTACFRHEALLYAGEGEFVEHAGSFVRAGVEAGEPVLVMVGAAKIDLLRQGLDGTADHVHFADMERIGANPARIIPAWRRFVGEHGRAGRALRGIGEPIWSGRSPDELVECQIHETLLNLAFADAPPFRLLCPYDVDALAPAVIDEAHRSHGLLSGRGGERKSPDYHGIDNLPARLGGSLPEPRVRPEELPFDVDALHALRQFVRERAADAGMSARRAYDLALAVDEVATNSLRYADGHGVLLVWREGDTMLCEVRDSGHIEQPLVGRELPLAAQLGGHGLWVANHVCDLVQIRSSAAGTAIRVHMRIS